MSDQTVLLRDTADFQTGFPFKSAEFTFDASATRLLRGDNIAQGRTRWDNAVRWSRDDVDTRYELHEGDVVLAMDRPWIGAGLKYSRISALDLPCFLVQRVARLRAKESVDQRYLSYVVGGADFTKHILAQQTGTAIPHISSAQILSFRFMAHEISEQQAIAEVLGALDDKIAANDRQLRLAGQLANALFDRAAAGGYRSRIDKIASLITRGATPKYVQSGGLTVLNQKCVRDQWVDLRPARMTDPVQVPNDRMLARNDVLVNSTGYGTLGRAARWTRLDCEATVDTHISIVRFDESLVDPICAGLGALELEDQIESLAQGSTGQTELRRDLLGGLELRLPSKEKQPDIGRKLREFDDLAVALRAESARLAATRDELLPLLMSGKVRVRDAERRVEDAL